MDGIESIRKSAPGAALHDKTKFGRAGPVVSDCRCQRGCRLQAGKWSAY
jgi:hypothetical protein